MLMERYAEAVYGARSALSTKSTLRDTEYDLGLLNADIGMGGDDSGYIEDLTDDLVDSDYKDFSLLFYGPCQYRQVRICALYRRTVEHGSHGT